MVSLSSIPFLGEVVDKISDLGVAAMSRSLKYMFCYKSLVNELNSEIGKLNNEKVRVDKKIMEERDSGKIVLYPDVSEWLKEVEDIEKKDRELSPSFRCIQCLPIPNPVSRLRLGREAVKDAKQVTKLTASGKELLERDIAYRQKPEYVPNNDSAFQKFASRQEDYENLWEQLVSEGPQILGIYGMPGVGKTQMMEQICKDAQEKKIFDKITKAVVGSNTFDVIKLQEQLAKGLKCNLESKDDKKDRADQLKKSMMYSGKIFIIFDDVWGEISLYDIIGTSFDDFKSWKGCKILYTSREKYNCLINKCDHPVEISTLEDKEALDLFKNTLGTYQTDSPPDESQVEQVCRKCGNLPLVIHAVGNALKLRTRNIWEDALKKLEDYDMSNISGIDPKVYACLKLSFDNLQEDEKHCLFLCSLSPADAVIDIDDLLLLTTGSQIVKGGKIRVRAIVDTLKSSSLLLPEGEDGQKFKLHDIIRDVARTIAKKDYAFIIEKCCGRGLPGDSADYSAGKLLFLEVENEDFSFPPDLVCPDLHTFLLVATNRPDEEHLGKINIPKISGGMFLNLRFLMLEGFDCGQQLYLQPLNKLKTLIIGNCNMIDTDVTSFPESLETLFIWSGFESYQYKFRTRLKYGIFEPGKQYDPVKIARRRIVLWGKLQFEGFQNPVARAEEVILQNTNVDIIRIWNSNIEAFQDLRNLTIRDSDTIEYLASISPDEIQSIPWQRSSFTNLSSLRISGCRVMKYLFNNFVAKCLGQLQELYISQCEMMEVIVINESESDGDLINFPELKVLHILSLKNLKSFCREKKDMHYSSSTSMMDNSAVISVQPQPQYLFDGTVAFPSLEVLKISYLSDTVSDIWGKKYYDNESISFSTLKSLKVSMCSGLKNVFQHSSNAGHFIMHIKKMNLSSCKMMREIIGTGEKLQIINYNIIVFPKLTKLTLVDLPNLSSLSRSQSGESNAYKVKFPALSKLTIKDLEINLELALAEMIPLAN